MKKKNISKETTAGTTTTEENHSTSATQGTNSQLQQTKEVLHKLIDDITELDYVETNSRVSDISMSPMVVHQIFIEKKGNIKVSDVPNHHHCHHHFDDSEEDDEEDM